MPFCPKCRFEYKVGSDVCPDCGERLVDSLPVPEVSSIGEEPERVYERWVSLVRLTSQQYAAMVLEALHAEQIPAVTRGGTGHFGQTGQMGMSSFRAVGGGYTLAVPEEFVEQADAVGAGIMGEDWVKARLIDIG
ncbi:MAG: hypothetical protein KKA42_11680 [candidate division Zixibacteria bacterium]|nr:hypothetical protein [candidate division Zixibacteria bacterium]